MINSLRCSEIGRIFLPQLAVSLPRTGAILLIFFTNLPDLDTPCKPLLEEVKMSIDWPLYR